MSRRQLIWTLAILGGVVLVASVLAGILGPGPQHQSIELGPGKRVSIESSGSDDFNWELAALVGTALGTTLLALATAFLAVQTREEVGASREALQITTRPLIVDAPRGVFVTELEPYPFDEKRRLVDRAKIQVDASTGGGPDDEGYAFIAVPLHNVGSGLALIEDAELDGFEPGFTWRRSALQTAAPAGQLTEVRFEATIDVGDAAALSAELRARGVEPREFSVEVTYTDLNGGQRLRSRVEVRGGRDWWHVTRVLLFDGDASEPYATLVGQEAEADGAPSSEPEADGGTSSDS